MRPETAQDPQHAQQDCPTMSSTSLDENANPIVQFGQWLKAAEASEPNDPNAMNLATCNAQGHPSSRMVLLKSFDHQGFVFYTNRESHKGTDLQENPRAALCLHWKSLRAQIRVEGHVETVSEAEADAYFASRPRDSRIGAWASSQSRPLGSRFELEKRIATYGLKFGFGDIPRPPYWSGFRVVPAQIEFWRDRPFRLHDRIVYTAESDGTWTTKRLYP
ncbi:pyridoxamine 5'-phosphate oxidase [Haematospirillum sp. 15-248]|nr:pyridoxamine 5'-phosphate oxidase [Haematospirillum sp. 15-248]NKD87435.1 pyridoxamine 5'-phosphate oxidase [Haematospirillum sp. 15-248]